MVISAQKITIGRYDKIDLPEMNLVEIDAKIDTGADGSAIHCHYINIVKKKGKKLLHIILLDPSHPKYDNRSFYFDQYKQRTIKNSFGNSEKRYVVKKIQKRLCAKCGMNVDYTKEFCPNCANRLLSKCAQCGSKTILGLDYCQDCGGTLYD